MFDFQPTEEQRLIETAVRDLARSTLRDRIREFEDARALPPDVRRTMAEMGLSSACLPEFAGGQGLGMVAGVLIDEALAYGDAAVPYAAPGAGMFGRAILELGTPEQQARHLDGFGADSEGSLWGAVAFSEAHPSKGATESD